MKSFTDAAGRTWSLTITAWEVRVVREKTGILLTEIMDEKCQLLVELYRDPILLVDVLWPLVEEQATQQNVTLREFSTVIAGDLLAAARQALVEATIDFFEDPETRAGLRDVLRKMLEIGEKMRSGSVAMIQGIDATSAAKSILTCVSNTPVFAE